MQILNFVVAIDHSFAPVEGGFESHGLFAHDNLTHDPSRSFPLVSAQPERTLLEQEFGVEAAHDPGSVARLDVIEGLAAVDEGPHFATVAVQVDEVVDFVFLHAQALEEGADGRNDWVHELVGVPCPLAVDVTARDVAPRVTIHHPVDIHHRDDLENIILQHINAPLRA